ncbi:GNAT family N-acetyltransferase [Lentzea aerocolonigenes]|uniref:GNAT family N-acetyltransferase n=1 Tax=Lentzea aerocolonigenes TaxID=68170 RepID=UPI0012E22846|nr:N-acetyltransferase [Lentzea aerocolonigenes]
MKELDRRMALGALVNRWITGWTKIAGLVREPRARRVLTDEGETSWHATQMEKGDWITVPTNAPEQVTAILTGVGLKVRPRETFMRRLLTNHPAPEAPDGYTVEVTREDVVIEVRVLRDGAEAASGLIAVVGEDAVPHGIATTPGHRRRGLASVVMGVLAREAVAAGATTGLLFASEDGLPVYRTLGWEAVSDVVIAEGKS